MEIASMKFHNTWTLIYKENTLVAHLFLCHLFP